jgi:hypothetical protein
MTAVVAFVSGLNHVFTPAAMLHTGTISPAARWWHVVEADGWVDEKQYEDD